MLYFRSGAHLPQSFIFLIAASLMGGCKKAVMVDAPVNSLVTSTVFSNNVTAAAAVTGVYYSMVHGNTHTIANGIGSISCFAGLSADELDAYYTGIQVLTAAYENNLTNTSIPGFWQVLYNYIYQVNTALEGLAASSAVTPSLSQQLTGEAKFLRAFSNFYLVNLYGDVPLVTTTNFQVNNSIGRATQAQLYQQMITDLQDAESLLGNSYLDPTGAQTQERIRPNKAAAAALLARVYLYTGDWADAYTQSNSVINQSQYALLNGLDSVFLANSQEAIWQLAPVDPGYNTYDGPFLVLTGAPGNAHPVALKNNLINAFEAGDLRLADWVGIQISGGMNYYFPNKYKVNTIDPSQPITEYVMVLRLSEQYLIRAEAEANGVGGGISAAMNDLNTIRTRAGLPVYTGSQEQDSVLNAIYHERQVELFTEWGHRWLDLKRTGVINSVMGSPGNVCQSKGGSWSPDWQYYPIPPSELLDNPNLTQTPGY